MANVSLLSSVHRALDGRIFYREARTLARAGHAVTVVALHPRDEVVDGVQILGLAARPRAQRPLLWRTLLRRAVATQADIFHIHDPELLAIVPWLRQQTGRPVIYDVHEANAEFAAMKAASLLRPGTDDRAPQAYSGLIQGVRDGVAALEPRLAAACAGIIAADERIAQTFADLARPQAVLYNYPTLEFVEEAAHGYAQSPASQTAPTILHLGTHTAARGARLMIEAFALFRTAIPSATLLLVGPFHPPVLADELNARAHTLGLEDGLVLVGQAPFADVGRYLREATVGWIPLQSTPKYEMNIPTKLFEYMAYELPIVSSDLAPVRPYLAGGECGLLVESDNPSAHAAALLALLRNPAQAAQMGAAGRRLVETRYNWSIMEPHLIALYNQLLAQG